VTGVIVTGPPRSGTSATARLLDLRGMHTTTPSDRVGGGPNNPTGHWESRSTMAANNRLLERAGVRWWCPPPFTVRGELEADEAATFREVHVRDPWLCKDPRFAMTLPSWAGQLDDLVAVVVLVRQPAEVIASLRRTWPLTVEHAAALWVRYTALALAVSSWLPTVAVPFPAVLGSPGRWFSRLDELLVGYGTGLARPDRSAELMFIASPRGADGAAVPGWATAWWWELVADLSSIAAGIAAVPTEPAEVEDVLGPLREDLRAGHPIDTRPVFARAGDDLS
jgi:hypothetical protein